MRRSGSGGTWIPASAEPICTHGCRESSARSTGFVRSNPLGPFRGRTSAANILTYFQHRVTNATAEGLNSKIQMVKEMACGFRNREHYKTAIYFQCGGLDLYPRLEASG